MSGDVFAAQVRSVRPTIGIDFATGNDRVHADAADEAGPVLLRKPYDAQGIAAAIKQALTRA